MFRNWAEGWGEKDMINMGAIDGCRDGVGMRMSESNRGVKGVGRA